MRFSKKTALFAVLLAIAAIVLVVYFVNMGRVQNIPNEVLDNSIQEIMVVKSASDEKTISNADEIETLIQLLETNRWTPKNLGLKCMPDYTLILGQNKSIGLLCINQETGYSRVTYKNKTYYYSMPLETYNRVSNLLEDFFK